MSEQLHPLDIKPKARKKSDPVFVDGKGQPIVDHRSTAPENARYTLEPHLCTICLGRLLKRRLAGRKPRFEVVCSNCGESHFIEGDEPINCWCQKTAGMYGNLFECFPNPDRKIVKNEYLVRERPHIMKAPEHIFKPAFSDYTDYL